MHTVYKAVLDRDTYSQGEHRIVGQKILLLVFDNALGVLIRPSDSSTRVGPSVGGATEPEDWTPGTFFHVYIKLNSKPPPPGAREGDVRQPLVAQ
ncbi:uncharacterized protein ARMOST_20529 [Armillaria ostoyae]|uniref:Uncharacterized protein n=1 Tax=Armillaria ostoyae TaxID=47428 RepID=A0A284S7K5_ARMOS|nr:uncharacterized protein ARMOST_20529 [Armillaria ostoyae]